jgi:hypothetical protein
MAKAAQTPQKYKTALLSAIGASSTGSSGMPLLFGEPVIAFQIDRLRKIGFNRFWIEIDTMPGAIVAVADKLRQQGMTVEFVRSPQELSGKLAVGELLFVEAEGILADEVLLTEMVNYPAPVVATLDGRDENAVFERIDLNTRWTGLALLDSRTIDGIAALPDGWSIGSSLLRQALQDMVPHQLVKQSVVQSGQLRRIGSAVDANSHTKNMVSARAKQARGWIESRIFGPLAPRIAPLIWPIKSREIIIEGCAIISGAISAGLAFAGFGVAAASFAILSIFVLCVRYCLHITTHKGVGQRVIPFVTWGLLAASFFAVLQGASIGFPHNLFPGFVVVALLWMTRKHDRGGIIGAIMPSPAMVALLILISSLTIGPVTGAMVIAMLQIGLLLLPESPTKNNVAVGKQA